MTRFPNGSPSIPAPRRALGAWLLGLGLVLGGCASLPPPVAKPASTARNDVDGTTLAGIARSGQPTSAAELSGFRLLPEAAFAYDARIALIRAAEKSLDVQYYLVRDDDVGLHLMHELRDAADRGVRVRLLFDDLYTAGQDELFAALAAHPNIEVRLFNPFPSRASSPELRLLLSAHEFSRINHRMHNKLLVADNSLALAGGRNIANEYFMRSTAANFVDIDVLCSGPVVRALSAAFDSYWNSEQVRSIGEVAPMSISAAEARRRFDASVAHAAPDVPVRDRDVLGQLPVSEQMAQGRLDRHWGRGRVYVDDPAKITRHGSEAMHNSVTEAALAELNSAKEEVSIASPYFIPGQRGLAMMRGATARGGRIEVITNSLGATDEPLAYAGYERYRLDLLKAGVSIYEIAPDLATRSERFGVFGKSISRLHAKLAVIDHQRIFIGSMNLDHRSAAVNTEIGIVIESPELTEEFDALLAKSRQSLGYQLRLSVDKRRVEWLEYDSSGERTVHQELPGSFLWLRLKNWLLLPLVGEDLL